MKPLFRLLTGSLFALAPVFASAQQAHTITYGRATVNFASSFQQQLNSLGATLTDLSSNPLANGVAIFEGTEGVVDLQTGIGEFTTRGGYMVSASGAAIKVQNLVVDLSNPNAPIVTGIFVVNGVAHTRQPIFNLTPPPTISLPLTPSNGVEALTGFGATLAPAAENTINNIFGGPVFQGTVNIGTVDFYAVLAATNGAL